MVLRDMLKRVRPGTDDEVIAIDAVEGLWRALEQHPDTALVITDLDLPVRATDGSLARHTGLQSLLTVQRFREAHRSPAPQTAIMTTDTEYNRLLLTLAAFQLMQVPPVDYLPKSQFSAEIIIQLVNSVEMGGAPGNIRYRMFAARRHRTSLMGNLVGDIQTLRLWQAIHDEHGIQEVAQRVGIARNTAHERIRKLMPYVAEVESMMQGRPRVPPSRPDLEGVKYPALKAFAHDHTLFFFAPEAEEIVMEYARMRSSE
jgi:DNA-binding NarL/FixJ family response regulator